MALSDLALLETPMGMGVAVVERSDPSFPRRRESIVFRGLVALDGHPCRETEFSNKA